MGSSIRCRVMEVGNESNRCRKFLGGVLVWRGQMVLLMKNTPVLEGPRRESILAWLIWLGVSSMRYMGSPDMVQIITLVIIAGTKVPFESI